MIKYRREIDGLRAIAVLSIILFHAGFELFSGGFTGVDIFFVISGYVITQTIVSDLERKTFSIVDFYERRARRLLPALFLVMFVCLPLAWLWLLPQDIQRFSQSLMAVSIFSSNFYFWQTSNYFENAAELKPLLHTWSLSVEEQYYVLFPIFLVLTWKLGKRWVLGFLAAVFLLSLLATVSGWFSAMITFYLLPTRCWEILVGTFSAFLWQRIADKRLNYQLAELGGAIGLATLVYSIFVLDEQTPFPGLYTLAPTIGTALIILCSTHNTLIGKWLGNEKLVGIGLMSYSAYLWHQPLFAFARNTNLQKLGSGLATGLVLLTFVLAYLSWKYVELPFREKGFISRKKVFLFGAMATNFFFYLGLWGFLGGGSEFRLDGNERAIAAYSRYAFGTMYRRHKCFMEPGDPYLDFSQNCVTTNERNKSLLLWGDSYTAGLSVGLRNFDNSLIQYTTSFCPPVIDTNFPDRKECAEINNFVMREIARLKPHTIFLHANWIMYRGENAIGNIGKTLESIKNLSPSSEMVIIGGLPQWEPTLPIYAIKHKATLDKEQLLPMNSYESLALVDSRLKAMSNRYGIRFISALDKSCLGNKCSAVVAHNGSFELSAWDKGHLTEGGSLWLARKIWDEYTGSKASQ